MERHVPILNGNGFIDIQSIPQLICPSCGKIITVILLSAFDEPLDGKRLFIGYFSCCGVWSVISCNQTGKKVDIFASWQIDPYYPLPHKYFSSTINRISPQFETIYNEALTAQKLKLLSICGAGYRKALECLIKDYCIHLHNDRKETIIKCDTGVCIGDNIDSQTVKEIAERAIWLGNDESHYAKRWTDKDTDDLVEVISFLCKAIEQDEERKQLVAEMPEQKKK